MTLTLVVLAAGSGSRYGGPKQLDGVGPGGETLLEYSVGDAVAAGFGRVVLVVREAHAAAFEREVVPRLSRHVEVRLARQAIAPEVAGIGPLPRDKPWGTAHAVLAAREAIGDTAFAVVNADDHYGPSAYRSMATFLTGQADATHFAMVAFRLAQTLSPHGPVSRGLCRVDADGRLLEVVERTRLVREGERIMDLDDEGAGAFPPETPVSMNFWGFHPAILPILQDRFVAHLREQSARRPTPRTGAELYLPVIVDELVRAGDVRVSLFDSPDRWHGLTSAADREGVRRHLATLGSSDRDACPNERSSDEDASGERTP